MKHKNANRILWTMNILILQHIFTFHSYIFTSQTSFLGQPFRPIVFIGFSANSEHRCNLTKNTLKFCKIGDYFSQCTINFYYITLHLNHNSAANTFWQIIVMPYVLIWKHENTQLAPFPIWNTCTPETVRYTGRRNDDSRIPITERHTECQQEAGVISIKLKFDDMALISRVSSVLIQRNEKTKNMGHVKMCPLMFMYIQLNTDV